MQCVRDAERGLCGRILESVVTKRLVQQVAEIQRSEAWTTKRADVLYASYKRPWYSPSLKQAARDE